MRGIARELAVATVHTAGIPGETQRDVSEAEGSHEGPTGRDEVLT